MSNEQDATVNLLRELMCRRDGAFFIDYFNDDLHQVTTGSLCVLYTFDTFVVSFFLFTFISLFIMPVMLYVSKLYKLYE